jgi:predicted metalloprotease with PDZ domain
MKHLFLGAAAALSIALASTSAAHAQGGPELAASLATQSNPETIVLDARKAPLGIAYSHMTIPVTPGVFTIDYPEWIPGEHSPDGPLNDMSQLVIKGNGKTLSWHRDQVDMYAFHVDVPQGVSTIDVDFTVLLNGADGTYATPSIMVGNWNRYLLYARNIDNHQYYMKASMIMPAGWDYASALPVASRTGDRVDFDTVNLATLVDSPTDMGRYVKHYTTWTGPNGVKTYLDIFADHPQDLDIKKKVIEAYDRLTPEAIALYGGYHFGVYHAELTLSDAIGFQGIEHHQSSDDRASDNFMVDKTMQKLGGDLIPHEFSHSWNGKYRRPFDLIQPDYNEPHPEHTELLWQYEGMNQYMGDMLSFRSGIRNPKEYPEYLAALYANLAYEPGRKTTPIIDTTTGAPYYYMSARGVYPSLRRTAGDFYTEGELMWLDADTIIREKTHGQKSLDDYTKVFAGGVSGVETVPYTREDIEHYLSQVVPYDWHGFFQKWVYSIAPQPPTKELARAGYKLVFTDKPNFFASGRGGPHAGVNSWFDAGIRLSDTGQVGDVREDSAAWQTGLAPGQQVVAVNGQQFSPKVWEMAIKDAKGTTTPIELLVKQGTWYKKYQLSYHDGVKFPHLVRIPGTPDMLAKIMAPHAKPTPAAK